MTRFLSFISCRNFRTTSLWITQVTDWTLDCILDVEISKIQDKYDWGMNYTQNTKIMTRFKGKKSEHP